MKRIRKFINWITFGKLCKPKMPDLKLDEIMQSDIQLIYSAFGIPPHLIGNSQDYKDSPEVRRAIDRLCKYGNK